MIAVSVLGADSVARGLGTLAARVLDLTPGFDRLGARMREVAVPITPVESGRLVGSLTADAGAQGVTFTSDVIYAGVQNRRFGFGDAAASEAEARGATEIEELLTDTARRAGLT